MRALAVRQDNVGDVVLSGPAVRALARRFDEVVFLASPTGVAAARLLPGVGRVLCARTEWIDASPRPVLRDDVLALADEIRSAEIDQAFVFTSWHQSPLPTALVLRLAGVPRVHAVSEDYPGSLLDTRARVPDDVHEVERNLALVRQAGVEGVAPQDDALALRGLPPRDPSLPGAYVVVHPGATVSSRAWAPERNARLVRVLAARGERVVVTGSEGERELCAFVAGDDGHVVCDRDLAGYAAVVRDARAIVVGNTAGAHVAAAVGTPVVSLFPPTIPAVRFRPWRVPHVLLGDQTIACAGCHARICPVPGHPCLESITDGDVVAALERLAPDPRAAAAPAATSLAVAP